MDGGTLYGYTGMIKKNKCLVCSCHFTDDGDGVTGFFGVLPIAFCSTCFTCALDMADEFHEKKIEQAVKAEREACAKLVEEWGDPMGASLQIRARGQK